MAKGRWWKGCVLAVMGALLVSAAGPGVSAADPSVELDAAFSPAIIPFGGSSTLILTLTAPAGETVSNIAFAIRPGYGVELTPGMTQACGGTVTIVQDQFHGPPVDPGPAAYMVELANGAVSAGLSCAISLPVTGAAAETSTWGPAAYYAYVNLAQLGTLTVTPVAEPPTAHAVPNRVVIAAGQPATLTLTVSNPNTVSALSDVGANIAVDGAVLGQPALFDTVSRNTCGGIAQPVSIDSPSDPASDVFGLFLSEVSLPPNDSCQLTLSNNSTYPQQPGTFDLGVGITAAESGPGAGITVPITITNPTTPPPRIRPATAMLTLQPRRIPAGHDTTLTVRLANPNTTTLTGIEFTQLLPRGISVPRHRVVRNTCGGSFTVSGGKRLTLAGGRLKPAGTCVIRLKLVAARAWLVQAQDRADRHQRVRVRRGRNRLAHSATLDDAHFSRRASPTAGTRVPDRETAASRTAHPGSLLAVVFTRVRTPAPLAAPKLTTAWMQMCARPPSCCYVAKGLSI